MKKISHRTGLSNGKKKSFYAAGSKETSITPPSNLEIDDVTPESKLQTIEEDKEETTSVKENTQINTNQEEKDENKDEVEEAKIKQDDKEESFKEGFTKYLKENLKFVIVGLIVIAAIVILLNNSDFLSKPTKTASFGMAKPPPANFGVSKIFSSFGK